MPKGWSINHIKQSKCLNTILNSLKKNNLKLQDTATLVINHRMKYVFLVIHMSIV